MRELSLEHFRGSIKITCREHCRSRKKSTTAKHSIDIELNFPGRACNDATDLTGIVGRHQECQDLISKMIGLCDGIRKKATENEKANRS
jgi:hypothetical protein